MSINAHIGPKPGAIDGVKFRNTHSGQKRAYGDSYYEYDIESDLDVAEVERICSEKIYKAIPKARYDADMKSNWSMDNAFRSSYTFRKVADGKYRYVVTYPYAD